jgi:hypothetical protein
MKLWRNEKTTDDYKTEPSHGMAIRLNTQIW